MQDRYKPNTPTRKDDCGCKDKDNNDTATQKSIVAEREIYCEELKVAAGEVYQWEENYYGSKELKRKKKCLFVWTEKNYQVFRNLEVTTGVSLVQFNESIKDSTTGYIKSNKSLADGLKDVLKKVKELKAKVYGLRDAADDLRRCTEETCNCSQWGILTGNWKQDCKGDRTDPPKRPPECDDIENKFKDLFCIPIGLAGDADSIFKAAADVVGIQVFSNIATLESLQKNLYDSAKSFDKHLQDTMKKNQDELKTMQDEFVKAVQSFSKSKTTLYSKRSIFDGVFDTVDYFCCPDCGCVEKDHKCEERLKECKERICKICDEVKDTFCECSPPTTAS